MGGRKVPPMGRPPPPPHGRARGHSAHIAPIWLFPRLGGGLGRAVRMRATWRDE